MLKVATLYWEFYCCSEWVDVSWKADWRPKNCWTLYPCSYHLVALLVTVVVTSICVYSGTCHPRDRDYWPYNWGHCISLNQPLTSLHILDLYIPYALRYVCYDDVYIGTETLSGATCTATMASCRYIQVWVLHKLSWRWQLAPALQYAVCTDSCYIYWAWNVYMCTCIIIVHIGVEWLQYTIRRWPLRREQNVHVCVDCKNLRVVLSFICSEVFNWPCY